MTNPAVDILLGVAIGDAVGVPYEFKNSFEMKQNPARDMVGHGTYNQPKGTWSDDSSLTFCLAASLVDGYNLADMAAKFIAWRDDAYWTAHGNVFDIGITTSRAISELRSILSTRRTDELKKLKLTGTEYDNGNGSLMRISPLLFYIKGKSIENQFEIVHDVSALTHKHIRAAMACMIYLKLAEHLLNGKRKNEAYQQTVSDIKQLWSSINFPITERQHFSNIIDKNISDIAYENLKSGGYVIESIEASLWCFLNTNDYKEAILKSINLGHDTDTTAAITGGLAGLYYGSSGIPSSWQNALAKHYEITALGNLLYQKYGR